MALFSWLRSKPSDNINLGSIEKEPEQGTTEPKYQNPAFRKDWDKIKFAFKSGGVNYFCLSADVNIKIERMVAAREIYREAEWRLTPALIQQAISAINKLIFDPEIKVGKKLEEISKVSVLVSERLNLAFQPSMDLKFASIVYFDETENIAGYDYQYAEKKIKNWVTNGDIPAFFLQMQEAKLIPGGAELAKVSRDFLEGLQMETTLNLLLMQVTMQAESTITNEEQKKILDLQRKLESALKTLATSQLSITT